MTAKDLAKHLGHTGNLSIAEFSIRVKVMDARLVYGRVQYQVAGHGGNEGLAWVDAGRVRLDEPTNA